mgnify:FL=1|tara:strand:+ start:705 stop:1754 length:1050 start_codon:yes stop_codon:yes gene_type:complete
MSDEIYDGVDGEDVANLYEELYTLATDYANAKSTEQAKFKKKYPKKYGTIRRLLVNEIHSSNKAGGGKVNAPREVDIKGQDHMLAYITPEEGGLLQLMGGAGKPGPMGIPSFFDTGEGMGGYSEEQQQDYSDSYGDSGSSDSGSNDSDRIERLESDAKKGLIDEIESNPQLKGSRIAKILADQVNKNQIKEIEYDDRGRITGAYHTPTGGFGLMGVLSNVLGKAGLDPTVYTGYGAGSRIPDSGDSGEEPSKMIRKIVEEKKKTESPLTEEELDYYVYGLGSKSKPMKTLSDVNQFISGLYSDTASPVGSKLSDNKRYLTLPNGKVIDLKTGKQLESVDGLELFMGGRI